jgi:hypothetical protein
MAASASLTSAAPETGDFRRLLLNGCHGITWTSLETTTTRSTVFSNRACVCANAPWAPPGATSVTSEFEFLQAKGRGHRPRLRVKRPVYINRSAVTLTGTPFVIVSRMAEYC